MTAMSCYGTSARLCPECLFITFWFSYMKINYRTQGTCRSNIEVEVENDIITDVHFTGGCNGNLQGISSLVKGMKVDDVISRLEGIHCGSKATSCPDQLCKALRAMKA